MALQDKYCYHPHLLGGNWKTEVKQVQFVGILTINPTTCLHNLQSYPHSLSQSSSAEPRLSMCVPEHMKKEKTNQPSRILSCLAKAIDQQTSSQASFYKRNRLGPIAKFGLHKKSIVIKLFACRLEQSRFPLFPAAQRTTPFPISVSLSFFPILYPSFSCLQKRDKI